MLLKKEVEILYKRITRESLPVLKTLTFSQIGYLITELTKNYNPEKKSEIPDFNMKELLDRKTLERIISENFLLVNPNEDGYDAENQYSVYEDGPVLKNGAIGLYWSVIKFINQSLWSNNIIPDLKNDTVIFFHPETRERYKIMWVDKKNNAQVIIGNKLDYYYERTSRISPTSEEYINLKNELENYQYLIFSDKDGEEEVKKALTLLPKNIRKSGFTFEINLDEIEEEYNYNFEVFMVE